MAGGGIESPVVTVLNVREDVVPCTWMRRIVHAKDVHNHPVDDLCLAVCLGVESSGFCELGVQQRPDTEPKCDEELAVPVEDDGLWYPKVDPNSFEEELGSICHCDILLAGYEDGHLRKPINDHKYTVISFLG
jgi:hypothetical protein